ncbi:hypothetical protein MS2017_0409 [Bathymodiolus thermophilus thioautotrophic gill symbiont]|uniref:Uncharacterized protein n=1 Tax=Bathymodiolus thermophilus thioautotrophic gill symbiont TaxID=2360 RepID=A0A3G3IKP7_9GAMM|nr:hypothetical protein [Bathymodiolus thermophilus thioautotrophic gill symbiont]AYQ56154.1 hypothetical protein MS2017_0409 [Bathymodiolus thermophilus thioautotrophic gill symbiont]
MDKGRDCSDIVRRTDIATATGGVVAELGGGKFANGALSAAFVYLFRESMHTTRQALKIQFRGGTKTERVGVLSDLNDIFGTKRRAKMLSNTQSPLVIDLSVKNRAYIQNVPSDTIYIDLNFHPKISTDSGGIPATTRRILSHELGHSVFGALDDGINRMNNINLNENPIMNELGMPLRLEY